MVFLLVSSGVLHVTVVSRWLSWELVDLRGLRGDSLSLLHMVSLLKRLAWLLYMVPEGFPMNSKAAKLENEKYL